MVVVVLAVVVVVVQTGIPSVEAFRSVKQRKQKRVAKDSVVVASGAIDAVEDRPQQQQPPQKEKPQKEKPQEEKPQEEEESLTTGFDYHVHMIDDDEVAAAKEIERNRMIQTDSYDDVLELVENSSESYHMVNSLHLTDRIILYKMQEYLRESRNKDDGGDYSEHLEAFLKENEVITGEFTVTKAKEQNGEYTKYYVKSKETENTIYQDGITHIIKTAYVTQQPTNDKGYLKLANMDPFAITLERDILILLNGRVDGDDTKLFKAGAKRVEHLDQNSGLYMPKAPDYHPPSIHHTEYFRHMMTLSGMKEGAEKISDIQDHVKLSMLSEQRQSANRFYHDLRLPFLLLPYHGIQWSSYPIHGPSASIGFQVVLGALFAHRMKLVHSTISGATVAVSVAGMATITDWHNAVTADAYYRSRNLFDSPDNSFYAWETRAALVLSKKKINQDTSMTSDRGDGWQSDLCDKYITDKSMRANVLNTLAQYMQRLRTHLNPSRISVIEMALHLSFPEIIAPRKDEQDRLARMLRMRELFSQEEKEFSTMQMATDGEFIEGLIEGVTDKQIYDLLTTADAIWLKEKKLEKKEREEPIEEPIKWSSELLDKWKHTTYFQWRVIQKIVSIITEGTNMDEESQKQPEKKSRYDRYKELALANLRDAKYIQSSVKKMKHNQLAKQMETNLSDYAVGRLAHCE
eukprot:Filipodium_phascolosomae@DN2658_c0_g1_i1.p1